MLLYRDSEVWFYVFTDGEVPNANHRGEYPASRLVLSLCAKHVEKHIPGAKAMKPGDSATLTVKLTKPKAAHRKAKAT